MGGDAGQRVSVRQNKRPAKSDAFAGPKNKEKILAGRFLNVGCLRTFWSLHNFEFDHVPFLQCAVAVPHNGGIVNEHIRAIVAPDKAVTFCVIEPFHGATQA